jgi:4-methyl-5(b-hydroxyethyl)-thiazole monophosphate biosynthesis
MGRVLVPIADGFEEIEAVTTIDILRRAGVEVVVAGLTAGAMTGSHGIEIQPDCTLDEALGEEYDMIVLPGGLPGADNLEGDERVLALVRRMFEQGRYTAAICAAPKVLAAAGVLDGRTATSYPGFLDPAATPGLRISAETVAQDGTVITSRGPGTAMDFALALVENLVGQGCRDSIEATLQRPGQSARPD